MGGTMEARGNVHDHFGAEFNFFIDPEAAFITLEAFPSSVIVSWECTVRSAVPWSDVDKWTAVPTHKASFFHKISANIQAKYRSHPGSDYNSCDMIAAAVMIGLGSVATDVKHVFATVELSGQSRSTCLVDWAGIVSRHANAFVVSAVRGYTDMVAQALARE